MELRFGMSRMRFHPSKSGFLAADWAGLKDYFMNPHVTSFCPTPGRRGAPNGSYGKDEIEPGRLAMAARSIRSVRLSLTNSE
jgi:hypothetical protein